MFGSKLRSGATFVQSHSDVSSNACKCMKKYKVILISNAMHAIKCSGTQLKQILPQTSLLHKEVHCHNGSDVSSSSWGCMLQYIVTNSLAGLVVKASTSGAEDPVFESRLRRDFSKVESSLTSLHLSLSLVDRWGTRDDWATTFLHSSLFSAFRSASPNFKPVHSVTLSSHLFFVYLSFSLLVQCPVGSSLQVLLILLCAHTISVCVSSQW